MYARVGEEGGPKFALNAVGWWYQPAWTRQKKNPPSPRTGFSFKLQARPMRQEVPRHHEPKSRKRRQRRRWHNGTQKWRRGVSVPNKEVRAQGSTDSCFVASWAGNVDPEKVEKCTVCTWCTGASQKAWFMRMLLERACRDGMSLIFPWNSRFQCRKNHCVNTVALWRT